MRHKLFVVGTFDQTIESFMQIDLMRCLIAAGVPPAAVVFKRSDPATNPATPVDLEIAGSPAIAVHVSGFNARGTIDRIRASAPDLLVYAGGKDLLKRPLLDSARLGCLGGHYGQLPAMRGMGTPEWSVLLGVPPTVAIQRMSTGVDTGDVVMQAAVPLFPGDNFTSVRNRSYFLTKSMLALAARRVLLDGVAGTPQVIEHGRQHFRMHPAIEARALRVLTARLSTQNS